MEQIRSWKGDGRSAGQKNSSDFIAQKSHLILLGWLNQGGRDVRDT
jgi:hypothetical protein